MGGRDLFILAGMATTIIGTLAGCVVARIYFVKAGLILAGVSICVGLANFGWEPLFGGKQFADTYFGCTMLALGLLSACLLAGLEELLRRLSPVQTQHRGFPVIAVTPDKAA